jgi:hypothetical protein
MTCANHFVDTQVVNSPQTHQQNGRIGVDRRPFRHIVALSHLAGVALNPAAPDRGRAQEGDTPSVEIDGNATAARDEHRAPYVEALQDRLLPLAGTFRKSIDHRPIARVHVSREVPKKYQRHSRKLAKAAARKFDRTPQQ